MIDEEKQQVVRTRRKNLARGQESLQQKAFSIGEHTTNFRLPLSHRGLSPLDNSVREDRHEAVFPEVAETPSPAPRETTGLRARLTAASLRVAEQPLNRVQKFWQSRGHETVSRLGRTLARGTAPLRDRVSKLHPAVFVAAGCAALALAVFFSAYTLGTTVTYDGEVVASVSSRSTAEEVRSDLESVTSRTLGEDYTIDDSLLKYTPAILPRQDVVDSDTLDDDISDEIGVV